MVGEVVESREAKGMSDVIAKGLTLKLLAVMSEVNYIKKDKKNEFHKYNYASEKAIKEALHPALVKHGVLFLPIACDVLSDIEIITSKGNKERLMTIRFAYRFVDAETGEFFEAYSMGTGTDSSDKSVYKALSGAIKYALTGTFLIPTGDDPESDEGGQKQKRGSAEAQAEVRDRKLAAGRAPEPPDAPPPPADDPGPAPAQKGPQAVPTTKDGVFLGQTKAFKESLTEPLYRYVLKRAGYAKSNEAVTPEQKATLLKKLAAAQKVATVASHGEFTPNLMSAEVFALLPDTSVAAIMKEFRAKLTAACGGQEIARDEYEAARKECENGTQFDFCMALMRKYEHYSTQGVA